MHQGVQLGKDFRISEKRWLSDNVFSVWLEAPDIARAWRPGQFVIVRIDETGERIPLTVAAVDESCRQIHLVVQVVGYTTRHMSLLRVSDLVLDVVGPLGHPVEIRKYPGPVMGIGGGVGAAPLLAQLKAYREAGNEIVSIIGARKGSRLVLVNEIQRVSHDLHITTEDGSCGTKGLVTDVLVDLLDSGLSPSLIIAIGPPLMMRAVCNIANLRRIRVVASLNPIMVDGTGMCGGCRVTVAGQTRFACVDGPDFDGSNINWEELISRLGAYSAEEELARNVDCSIEGMGN